MEMTRARNKCVEVLEVLEKKVVLQKFETLLYTMHVLSVWEIAVPVVKTYHQNERQKR